MLTAYLLNRFIKSKKKNAMLQVQEKAQGELECVICMEVSKKDTQVFSCLEHHLICLDCSKRILQECPVCKQNFRRTRLSRNRLAEKMILQLF
jgi:hypothetical protein